MIVAWLLFPLVLLVVCLGCGLAVERIGGWTLPGALLPSAGLALVIVVSTLTTQSSATARFTTWLVLAIALGGFGSSWSRARTLRLEPWALGVGVAVFLVCAAPVVLSGNATFLGYFFDNDSAFHFGLIDQLLSRGRDLSGIPYSSYVANLQEYLGSSYPTGIDIAVGAVRPLVAQDIAWIYQPYMAVILALGGTALYELLREAVRSRPLRATCAFIATQAGLAYSFYLEDSIKELATTLLITVVVVLVFGTLRKLSVRGLFPLLIVFVAALDVLNLAVVPWFGVPLATFAVLAIWQVRHTVVRSSRARVAISASAVTALFLALAAPVISQAATFVSVASTVLGTGGGAGSNLGNLAGPLQGWEVFGVWLNGDFRFAMVNHYRVGYALIGVVIASCALGIAWMVRRRALAPLLLLAGDGVAAAFLLTRSSPYAASKVMMILSVAIVLSAMLGVAGLLDSGRRIEGWLLAGVIGIGVLWTNALAYANSSVAPRARLAELAAIGARFNGQHPTLYNQVDEYAIHFIRGLAPFDAATGYFVPRPGLPPRAPNQARLPYDTDDIDLAYLEGFRLLVLGRSPRESRPPANFRLAYEGHYYDVWERASTPTVLAHLPLGTGLQPVAIPSCRAVTSLAVQARRMGGRLAYVAYPPVSAFVPTQGHYPASWGLVEGDPYELIPRQQGMAIGTISVPSPGRYKVWLEAALAQRMDVWIRGRHVGSVAYQLGPPGQYAEVGEVTLPGGPAEVLLARASGNLAPGRDSTGFLGPLMLVRDGAAPAVAQIDPSQAHTLCGRYLDWIEVVR